MKTQGRQLYSVKQLNKIESFIIGKAYEKPESITKKYAENELPALFIGETGTGKELFAND